MTNEQILKKAIEKAVKNGFDFDRYHDWGMMEINTNAEYAVIFSHDFAKHFWGEGKRVVSKEDTYWKYDGELHYKRRWKRHLQEMVLEEEPLKYIEKFL